MSEEEWRKGSSPLHNAARTTEFWLRATGIYASYKLTQLKALALRTTGKDADTLKKEVWEPQHEWAGHAMYDMCVRLRGFYLKAGQFLGSRGDFVPEQWCKQLALLCDKVPPMSPELTKRVICRELGIEQLEEVFDWIDLQKPLGSASISQVHKARLRHPSKQELKSVKRVAAQFTVHTVAPGQDAWDVSNLHAVPWSQLKQLNRGVDLEHLKPGQSLKVPVLLSLSSFCHQQPDAGRAQSQPSNSSSSIPWQRQAAASKPPLSLSPASAAVVHATAAGDVPPGGLVAVKVQYPDALPMMATDLKNLKALAYFLSKTEIKFDLVSALDELNKQIRLEFDFLREARVMDTIAEHLRPIKHRVQVPCTVHGLVTPRLLTMHFVEGTPLLEAAKKIGDLPAWKREAAKRQILNRVTEAYGRMILGEGLFQADGHPGNILIGSKGRIGLLDYGQSKQLSDAHREACARLILALCKGDHQQISAAMSDLGIVTETADAAIRSEMAYGMFDTRLKVNPFDPNSPLKKSAINSFPPDMFFVLRVVQLLRGMATGMGVEKFSSAEHWKPLAKDAVWRAKCSGRRGLRHYLPWPLSAAPLPVPFWN